MTVQLMELFCYRFTGLKRIADIFLVITIEPILYDGTVVRDSYFVGSTRKHVRTFSQIIDVVYTKQRKADVFFCVILHVFVSYNVSSNHIGKVDES